MLFEWLDLSDHAIAVMSRQLEVQKLQSELAEYEEEFSTLKNQVT